MIMKYMTCVVEKTQGNTLKIVEQHRIGGKVEERAVEGVRLI
jgi:hypothetical protein